MQAAKRIGVDKLCDEGGLSLLISEVRLEVFPFAKLEAKELYTHGHRIGGTLSRQHGESMLSYINRRRQWWKLLREMDDSVGLSLDILGDLLLDNADLSKTGKLLMLTSTGNDTSFEKIADAFLARHGISHWTSHFV